MSNTTTKNPTSLRIQIRQGQHSIIIGMNGTGKTTLAKRLMSTRPFPIVLDSKHEIKWRDFRVSNSIPIALKDTPSIYRPRGGGYTPIDASRLFNWIYRLGGYDVCVDEVYTLGRNNSMSYPHSYIDLLTRGRSRGIGVTTLTQRPKFLPRFAFTEARHIYLFALGSQDDRDYVAKETGCPELREKITGHVFFYLERESGRLVKYQLGKGDL